MLQPDGYSFCFSFSEAKNCYSFSQRKKFPPSHSFWDSYFIFPKGQTAVVSQNQLWSLLSGILWRLIYILSDSAFLRKTNFLIKSHRFSPYSCLDHPFLFLREENWSWFSIYVQYVSVPPTVSLDIGKALNLNDLEEGDDVYFECSISANPPPYKVTWLHNVGIQDMGEYSFISHRSFGLTLA